MTKDWKDIHEDFSKTDYLNYSEDFSKTDYLNYSYKTYRQHWEELSIAYEEVKEWVQIGFKPQNYQEVKQWKDQSFTPKETKQWLRIGLNKKNAYFAKLLLDSKYILDSFSSNSSNSSELNKLKENYLANNNDDWSIIHDDFTKETYKDSKKTYQQEWEKHNLTYQDAQEWIAAGFEPENYYNAKQWKNFNLTPWEAKAWIDIGLDKDDAEFVSYLKWKNIQPNLDLNLKQLKEEFKTWEKDPLAQEYLDTFYPLEKRKTIKQVDIYRKNLTGALDLSDFINLEYLDCYDNQLIKLKLDNCSQLKRLNCSTNQLIELDLTNLNQLEKLDCNYNFLSDLKFPVLIKQLTDLSINDNNLPKQDLSIFRKMVNLEELKIGNHDQERTDQGIYNKFYGSLESLKDLTKLEKLDISNTDIDSGLEYLPDSLKKFDCLADKGEDAKCKNLYSLIISDYWANSNKKIIKLVREQQLRTISKDQLSNWIPYKQLTDVKHLANGGFGKVYKANWNDNFTNRKVVLKSLNGSRNMTIDFLQEAINHGLLNNHELERNNKHSYIVPFYGISWDPLTKNYLMVMQYMEGGNLREYLRINNNQLAFRGRLRRLSNIATGLREIHEKELVHRDFHSGNILSGGFGGYSYITDLGLCQPTNIENKGEIYGVLPYVAPEILNSLSSELYTPKSDIYSFGMVAYELFANASPYLNRKYDKSLALNIVCDGFRPKLENIKIPQLLKDLIEQCWDADPKKRPTVQKLEEDLKSWRNEIDEKENRHYSHNQGSEFYQQYKAIEKKYNQETQSIGFKTHPTEVLNSCFLGSKNFPKSQNSETVSKQFYGLLGFDFPGILKSTSEYYSREQDFDIETKELVKNAKRQLSLESQTKTNQGESKLTKVDKQVKYYAEPTEIDYNWTNIYPSFIPELQIQWENNNFTYHQVQEWANAFGNNFNPQTDLEFINWLAHTKNLTPEQTLNHQNLESLKAEFNQSQQTAQTLQPTTRQNN